MELNSEASSAIIRLIDIKTITDEQLAAAHGWLSPSESTRLQRLARTERKRQFMAGRALLRFSIAQLLNIQARAISLSEQERQAPQLHIAGFSPVPFFSISHSGNWVACACSSSTGLGLDIEVLDAKRNLAAIAQHAFGADDLAWLQNQPDQVGAFYRLWSIKEARFKLTQSYAIAPVEHQYAIEHPAVSIVMMTGQALVGAPEYIVMEWESVDRFIQSELRA
ncbi:4'-phosphopantetheinyl transferase [Oxalobacteraceae bacterium GrIS 2.11]